MCLFVRSGTVREHRKRLQSQSESSSSQLSAQLTAALAERDGLTAALAAERLTVSQLQQQLADLRAASASADANAKASVRVDGVGEAHSCVGTCDESGARITFSPLRRRIDGCTQADGLRNQIQTLEAQLKDASGRADALQESLNREMVSWGVCIATAVTWHGTRHAESLD